MESPPSPRSLGNDSPSRHKYFAFISYSRIDSSAAKWLQNRLSDFSFPVKMVERDARPPHPRYVRPIYRDKTNLEVDDQHYWENIKGAIENSRYLILLCSPDSARSKPVEKEVHHFLNSSHDALSRILPVILSGSVTAKAGSSCLPPSLESLGEAITSRNLPTMVPDDKDSKKDGWENGLVGVLAFILKLDRASVAGILRREERKRATRLAAVSAAMLLLSIGVGVFWYLAEVRKKQVITQLMEASQANHAVGERLQREAVAEQNPEKSAGALAYIDQSVEFHPENTDANSHAADLITHSVLPRRRLAAWKDTNASYSPDGKQILLTAHDGKGARIYEVDTQQIKDTCPSKNAKANWSTHHPHHLYLYDGNHLQLFNTHAKGDTTGSFSIHFDTEISSIIQSPSSEFIAVHLRGSSNIHWINGKLGTVISTNDPLPGLTQQNLISISADGRFAAIADHSSTSDRLYIVRIADGRIAKDLSPGKGIRALKWTPKGDLIVRREENTILLSNTDWRPTKKSFAHGTNAHHFSPDGLSYLWTSGNTLLYQDISAPSPQNLTLPQGLALGSLDRLGHVTWSASGHRMAVIFHITVPGQITSQGTSKKQSVLQVYSTANLKPTGPAANIPYAVDNGAFTPDDRWFIASCDDGATRVINLEDGKTLGAPVRAETPGTSVTVSRDGRTFLLEAQGWSSDTESYLQLWSLADGVFPGTPLDAREVRQEIVGNPAFKHVPQDPGNPQMIILDTSTNEPFGKPLKHPSASGSIRETFIQPLAKEVCTLTESGELRVWNYETGDVIFGPITREALSLMGPPSPDGKRVAFSTRRNFNTEIEIHDIQENRQILQWTPPPGLSKWQAAFSHDGHHVLIYPTLASTNGPEGGARVFRLHKNRSAEQASVIRPLSPDGTTPVIVSATFARNSSAVFISCNDRTIRKWNVVSGNPVGEPVRAFSSNPLFLVSEDDRWLTAIRPQTPFDQGSGMRIEFPVTDGPIPDDLADVISGKSINPQGFLSDLTVDEWLRHMDDLQKDLAARNEQDGWRKISHWCLQHPWNRPVSPFSSGTLEEWLCHRIITHSDDKKSPSQTAEMLKEGIKEKLSQQVPPDVLEEMGGINQAAEDLLSRMGGSLTGEDSDSFDAMVRRLDPGHPLWPLADACQPELASSPEQRSYLIQLASERLATASPTTVSMGLDALLKEFYTPDHPQILALADRVIQTSPHMAAPHRLRAYALARLRQYPEAEISMNKAIEIISSTTDRLDANTSMPMSGLLWLNGKKTRSKQLFMDAVSSEMGLVQLDWITPQIARSMSLEVSIALLEIRREIIEEDPDLAQTWRDQGIDLDTGITWEDDSEPPPVLPEPLSADETFSPVELNDKRCKVTLWPDKGWIRMDPAALEEAAGPDAKLVALAIREDEALNLQIVIAEIPGMVPDSFVPDKIMAQDRILQMQRWSLEEQGMKVVDLSLVEVAGQFGIRSTVQFEEEGRTMHGLFYTLPGQNRLYLLQATSSSPENLNLPTVKKCFESFRCEGSK